MSLSARLDRLPLSKPHYALLLIGGLGYTFDGMDNAVVAFLLPDVRKAFSLSSAQLGLVASAAPFGFLFGAFLAGYLGDRLGRKAVMMYALALYAIASLVAAVSWNFEVFLIMRILAGLGAGAESAIIAPFLSEFVPSHRRGWFLGALAGFFSFGFVGAALIGRFVVPAFPEGWRWAQVITFVPIVLLLWWRRALPESPRFLMNEGKQAEAERVVIAFEDKVLASTGKSLPPVDPNHAEEPEPEKFSLGKALKFLWSRQMWRITSVTWLIWFVITFSYYGFFSWIPTLLISKGLTVTTSFTFSLYIYIAQIPGYFSAAWVNEKFDRKYTIASYLVGSAISAFWLSTMTDPALITAAGIALSFFLNGTYAGVYAYTPEVFPTWLRATGVGLSSSFGRIGSITAPLLIGIFATQWGFVGVFGMTTGVLAVGVICTLLFAVRTKGRSLEDITISEIQGREGARR
ncbi:putative MFS transporter [Arthrobacter sp. B2I5]|uniref:MFS transporter n=1 Tax=Arthrobacter sp. B2I5 TaxID=3042266 RepID=UPI002789C135|nr:MFS transporter [Arthrobacter sp. B2I5]MDQ0825992.1 putative MFS transporter [Arthrobacter sp. B2I5]